MMIATRFAIVLAAAFFWTTAFSMTNEFPRRGLRNLGILSCYIIGIIMFFNAGVKNAFVTWGLFGLISGGLYFTYDLVARAKTKAGEEKPNISFTHFLVGQIAWPIMGPEAIEYTLAELGLLKNHAVSSPSDKAESSQQ